MLERTGRNIGETKKSLTSVYHPFEPTLEKFKNGACAKRSRRRRSGSRARESPWAPARRRPGEGRRGDRVRRRPRPPNLWRCSRPLGDARLAGRRSRVTRPRTRRKRCDAPSSAAAPLATHAVCLRGDIVHIGGCLWERAQRCAERRTSLSRYSLGALSSARPLAGLAMACVVARNGISVTLLVRDKENARRINEERSIFRGSPAKRVFSFFSFYFVFPFPSLLSLIWYFDKDFDFSFLSAGKHPQYLSDIELPPNVVATAEPAEAPTPAYLRRIFERKRKRRKDVSSDSRIVLKLSVTLSLSLSLSRERRASRGKRGVRIPR